MGDVVGDITGGVLNRRAGRQAGSRINQATQQGVDQLSPTIQRGDEASNFIASLLGMGDPAQGAQALRQFQDSTGFQDQLERGSQAITGNAAAQGFLNSGATATALQGQGQQMAQQSLNNFIAQLSGLSNQGFGATQQAAGMRQQGGTNAALARMGGDQAFAQGIGSGLGNLSGDDGSIMSIFGGD